MKRFMTVVIISSFVCFADADVSYLFSRNSVMDSALASRGIGSASLGILVNPSLVSFSRSFEFSALGVYMPYDRFGAAVSCSLGLYKLTGVDFIGGVGVSVFLGGVNNIDLRNENGESAGMGSSVDYGVIVGYGTSISSLTTFPLDLGVSVKYLSSSFGSLSGGGVGVDIGSVFYPIRTLPDLGFSISIVNLFSSKTWSTGTSEMLPTKISLGAFYYLLDDTLLVSADINNTSTYGEMLAFRWINLDIGVSLALDPNLCVKLIATVGNQFSVSFGLNYDAWDFSKVGVFSWMDSIGLNSLGSLEFYSGSPRYLAKVIDPEVQRKKERERLENLEREHFSKAMVYFSAGDYRNAKKHLEEVIKINPENDTAKAMLRKIEDILALEE